VSKITTLYGHLLHQARATGRDQHAELLKGARLSVRIADGQITLTIARKGKRVGDVEMTTFRTHCGVPDGAIRWPAEGQDLIERDNVGWWRVAFRWLETPPRWEGESAFNEERRPELEAGDEQAVADAERAVAEGGYGYEEPAL
jgi:hypothetical protein